MVIFGFAKVLAGSGLHAQFFKAKIFINYPKGRFDVSFRPLPNNHAKRNSPYLHIQAGWP